MLQTAPVLLLFHPTVGPNAKPESGPTRFDFVTGYVNLRPIVKKLAITNMVYRSTDKAEPVHAWLTRQLPDVPHPPLVRPVNYFKIAIVSTSILGMISFFTIAAPYILPVIQNRNGWAAISLIAILLFTSGHMFNHIRKVPYAVPDGKGGLNYFAGGFQNQYGLETQIVAGMCMFFSFPRRTGT